MIEQNELKLILSKFDDIKDELKDIKDEIKDISRDMVTIEDCEHSKKNCTKIQELNVKKLNAISGLIAVLVSAGTLFISGFFGK